ncbi:hypothetical protein CR513_48180, partial [Mucuna pruriens]
MDKLIEKGWVWESKSSCAIPVILVPKKDRSWRMCMDFRPINKITSDIGTSFPVWMIFSTNCMIAFKTKSDPYEQLVIPFDLTNAPSIVMRLMDHVLRSLIGWCMVVYFDDILVYSMCVNNHVKCIRVQRDVGKEESLAFYALSL